jgi:hypothetical protein
MLHAVAEESGLRSAACNKTLKMEYVAPRNHRLRAHMVHGGSTPPSKSSNDVETSHSIEKQQKHPT